MKIFTPVLALALALSVLVGVSSSSAAEDAGKEIPLKESIEAMLRSNHSLKSIQENRSAVGHEIDFTIADFVADRRAETPTAAAEMAVPDTFKLREDLDNAASEMRRELLNKIEISQRHLQSLDPENIGRDLRARAAMETMRCENIAESMSADIKNRLIQLRGRMEAAGQLLKASDPSLILSRGYSIVRTSSGEILRNSDDVSAGEYIDITLSEGNVTAEVKNTEKRQ